MSQEREEQFRKCGLLILSQSQQDEATELVFSRAAGAEFPVKYRVKGIWHDWHGPPAHLVPGIIAELERLGGLAQRPFPKEGLIDVPYSGIRLHWTIRMTSAESDCVLNRA